VLPAEGIYAAPSRVHGRGVFATRRFAAGDVIERCPLLPVLEEQIDALDSTDLFGFSFEWEDGVALALGFGSLYNHSCQQNARYDHDYDNELIIYSAVRAIEAHDEITVNYSGDPDGRIELWFDMEDDECS